MTKAPATLNIYLFDKKERLESEIDFSSQSPLQSRCIDCSRPLKAQKSIERGRGPICAKKTITSGEWSNDEKDELLLSRYSSFSFYEQPPVRTFAKRKKTH